MRRVILEYTPLGHDEQILYCVLSKYNITIIKTINDEYVPTKSVVLDIDNNELLNMILYQINSQTTYGVSVVSNRILNNISNSKGLWATIKEWLSSEDI